MEAKFSPGPWRVADRRDILDDTDSYVVYGFDSDNTGVLRAEDAALIAAAPDLYEALREAADHFDRIYDKALHWQRTFERNDDACARWGEIARWSRHRANVARAALAKAKGAQTEGTPQAIDTGVNQ